jgi:hypothetical protein
MTDVKGGGFCVLTPRNFNFMLMVTLLSVLYFVSTGIQYWTTIFYQSYFEVRLPALSFFNIIEHYCISYYRTLSYFFLSYSNSVLSGLFV